MIRLVLGSKPFIEGAFLNKHEGRYYLQYAAPGTQFNVYSDGVYVSEHPLGPYVYQPHNPFSSKPGGFIQGAGHGSTFQDKQGNWWHMSTMRISVNESFERRIGLFPCGFDRFGTMFCNQNFADYPFLLPDNQRTDMDRTAPEWMLLSYGKPVTASSCQKGFEPEKAVNEDIRSWWAAAAADPGEWLMLDLGAVKTVKAVQINFSDHNLPMPALSKKDMKKELIGHRRIEVIPSPTGYVLEASQDAQNWCILRDTRDEGSDLAHDFLVLEHQQRLRWLRVSRMSPSFNGVPSISGLRVFGKGDGEAPDKVMNPQAMQQSLQAVHNGLFV